MASSIPKGKRTARTAATTAAKTAAKSSGKSAAKPATKPVAKPTARPGSKRPAPRTSTRAASRDAALLRSLREYLRAHGPQLLADPNITSVGIGHKQVAGVATPQLSIQFTVARKAAPEALEALRTTPIPPSLVVAGVVVPTDVLERSFEPSYVEVQLQDKDPRKARAEVIAPGMSVGNRHTSAGTIGAFVRDRAGGQLLLLSNWHVLHGPQGDIGVEVVQPGRHDDNRVEHNTIGRLLRSHLGPAGDCAVATVAGRGVSPEVLGLGVPIAGIGDPELDDPVVKSGRTTGVTRGRVVRIEVNTRMNYGPGVSAVIGGFEIGVDPSAAPADGEISRGGDSGAAWLALDARGRASGTMLGLHFAGDAEGTASEFALACYARSVMTALEIEPLAAGDLQPAAGLADGGIERRGFDRHFLPFVVEAPRFLRSRKADLARLDDDPELRYCHFSAWLSRARRYPVCVAWNIDGSQFKRLRRTSFRKDRRGDLADHQLDDALYRDNPLDKGHLARRVDLCWGPMEEARQGNHDSSYYTNVVPQLASFNQGDDRSGDPDGGVWGRLEDTVFDDRAPHQLRLSLMAGPVLGEDDRRWIQNGSECRIPNEFWKLIAYRDDADGAEKVYAFLLTQRHLLDPLLLPEGLDLAPWLWARIRLRDLESRTGLRFAAALHRREQAFTAPEGVGDTPTIQVLASVAAYFA